MKTLAKAITGLFIGLFLGVPANAQVSEIFCNIRETGGSLNCQWDSTDKRVMNADDISNFIDAGNVAAFVTLKSRKGMERTFKIDSRSPQYKRFNDLRKTASISEISTAKSNLFSEIEKKLIKLSDELDAQATAAELVLFDQSIGLEKLRYENRTLASNLESFKKNSEQACTSTQLFERISKSNNGLQQTLSDMLYAFQTPGTCLADFKIYKDKDGAVDLRQLSTMTERYKSGCKK